MKNQIIGQETLISEIEKIFQIFKTSKCEIRPHFVLTGASGSGKSLTIESLAKKLKLGFLEVNAAQLTKEGTSGNSLSKALAPMVSMSNIPTIIFVDEFDKLFISGNSNDSHAHESTTGVQNEFLKVLESNIASVFGDYGKYINVPANNTLFVFAGAFNGEEDITIDRLRQLGLKTEFLGRVGLIYNTKKLSIEDLFQIVDNSPLLDMYLDLFADVDREKTVLTIKAYIQRNYEFNTLGARLINTLIHRYFIKGGVLEDAEVREVSFQNKLNLN